MHTHDNTKQLFYTNKLFRKLFRIPTNWPTVIVHWWHPATDEEKTGWTTEHWTTTKYCE